VRLGAVGCLSKRFCQIAHPWYHATNASSCNNRQSSISVVLQPLSATVAKGQLCFPCSISLAFLPALSLLQACDHHRLVWPGLQPSGFLDLRSLTWHGEHMKSATPPLCMSVRCVRPSSSEDITSQPLLSCRSSARLYIVSWGSEVALPLYQSSKELKGLILQELAARRLLFIPTQKDVQCPQESQPAHLVSNRGKSCPGPSKTSSDQILLMFILCLLRLIRYHMSRSQAGASAQGEFTYPCQCGFDLRVSPAARPLDSFTWLASRN
jgi:hypothetical protein